MARKSKSKPATRRAASDERSERERIIDAFMALLAEKSIEQIGFAESAKGAGVSLSDLRGAFGSTVAILGAFVKQIDRAVLAGDDADMAGEPPRERLFDVLMRRIELLAPHKAAVRSLMRPAVRNPGLAVALQGAALRSQQWMLTVPWRGGACCSRSARSRPPTSAPPVGAASSAPKGLRCCSRRCCAPGSTTTIPASPAPWRRSTADSHGDSVGPACSTSFAGFQPSPAACARGGGAQTISTRK